MNDFNTQSEKLLAYLMQDKPFSYELIKSIMLDLDLSARISALLAYDEDKNAFKTKIKYGNLPENQWRYFKLNLCIYFTKNYNNLPTTMQKKHLAAVKNLNFLRFLNNWHSAYLLKSKSNIVAGNCYFHKSELRNSEIDIDAILKKADELALVYNYANAEEMICDCLLNPKRLIEVN